MGRKTVCGCNVCRYSQEPIDTRTTRVHRRKYGLYTGRSETCDDETSRPSTCRPIDVSDDIDKNGPSDVNDNVQLGVSYEGEPIYNDESTVDDGSEHTNTYNDQDSETISDDGLISDDGDSEISRSEDGELSEEGDHQSESEDQFENENVMEGGVWSADYDSTVYDCDLAVQKLPNSNVTLLQWLFYQFHMFVSHPSMSKSAFTHNLQVQKIVQNDKENLLPSTYYQARRLVDPFIVKKKNFSVCVNDCVIFRNNDKYAYADLVQCPVCKEDRYLKSSANSCRKIPRRKFIYMPIGPRLARIFGDVNLSQLVQSHLGSNVQSDDMWDIHDSPTWKELYSRSDDGYFGRSLTGLSFALELDGVNPFHNIGVTYSMTPIMLTLLNLPRHIRNSFENINLVGIIPGKGSAESPNLDPFVEILVDELLFLSGCDMYSAYNKAPVDVKIKLLIYVLDYPGFSKLFHQHGSGSLSGCHWCHIRGNRCEHLDKVIYLSNRSYLEKSDSIRKDTNHFVNKQEDMSDKPELRRFEKESSYRKAYEGAKNKAQASCVAAATGCKDTYALSKLPGHDRPNECQPDACHTVKDVVQNVMNLVSGNKKVNLTKVIAAEKKMNRMHILTRSETDQQEMSDSTSVTEPFHSETLIPGKRKRKVSSRGKSAVQSKKKPQVQEHCEKLPFLLTKKELEIADERAKNVRVPLGFGLKPSSFISKSGCLKSHDWKQLATQGILKFCLKDTLQHNCRKTLYLLFDCIADMCQEKISEDDIDIMEVKLSKALTLIEMYFPVHLQNITTHLLHHIPDGLRKFGPVYGTWMFVFERFNSWICKCVLNMRYPEATVMENISAE
ncbi:hypothetical protein ScPMuIL_005361 [Solemya velum]